jgi:hypothetical protein
MKEKSRRRRHNKAETKNKKIKGKKSQRKMGEIERNHKIR